MKYAVGVDFGTLSARAVLLGSNGEIVSQAVREYPHGVLDTRLPGGEPLGPDWALQWPQDWMESMVGAVRECVGASGVAPEQIIGIGIDFTSCTVLPTKADGAPLCENEAFAHEPHAYPKLWKHHAAQYCANDVNRVAEARNEKWLAYYGGRISSEWVIPKALQILREAPHIYTAMDRFIEAGDWIVWQLCGQEVRSECNAGFKAQWRPGEGYPPPAYFAALDENMRDFANTKLARHLAPLGARAGGLTAAMARRLGLCAGTDVSVGVIDAHAAVPGCGIAHAGAMLMAMGTSTCHLLLSEKQTPVPGVCGVVKNGIVPGLYAYEAGQSCVGDHFAWFIDNCVPASYMAAAKKRGLGIHQYLREKAQAQRPGESGLLALDWWNGVRSPLMDFDLSGVTVGLTLQTKPEDIYRALIEATAYGTRTIIETFERGGTEVKTLYAGGGIARKDPMMMQIYADVCNRPIHIAHSEMSAALGSAIYGFSAALPSDSLVALIARLGKVDGYVYHPNPNHTKTYTQLYSAYREMSGYFGRENGILHFLKGIKQQTM